MQELALSISQLHASLTSQPEVAAVCDRCHALLVSAERGIFAVQEHNTASVKAQLQQFIPQDFRGALLERQRCAYVAAVPPASSPGGAGGNNDYSGPKSNEGKPAGQQTEH